MHKSVTQSGTKGFPLTFQNIFLKMYTIYEYIFPSFLFLYPRDMHLDKISCLLECHCNHSICLREWIPISYVVYFQQWVAEATSSCTVQSAGLQHLIISFLLCCCHCYFTLTTDVLKRDCLPQWMITALWNFDLHSDSCMLYIGQ